MLKAIVFYGSCQRNGHLSHRADVIIFMILGQSAAVAASIAIDMDLAVQEA